MQKIALISYHFWYNYGTCLQAYALWKVLYDMGMESEYLNFGWKYPVPQYMYYANYWKYNIPNNGVYRKLKYRLLSYVETIKSHRLIKQLRIDSVCYSNNKLFDKFHKDLIIESERISSAKLKCVSKQYCKFIVGSDQVWNPDCCEEDCYKHFLLDFVDDNNKKFSYGSSIGKVDIDEHTKSLFEKYLKTFASISCRERTGCLLLEKTIGRSVPIVLDPTLLLLPDEWKQIARYKNGIEGAIVCYILGAKEVIVERAIELSEQTHRRLVILTTMPSIIDKYGKYVVGGVGPSEFVGLVDKCSFVVTDSFHGTAFAINFNKPFYSYMKREGDLNTSDNSRILDLLRLFGFEKCLKEDDSHCFEIDSLDFSNANEILARERKTSMKYLKSIV